MLRPHARGSTTALSPWRNDYAIAADAVQMTAPNTTRPREGAIVPPPSPAVPVAAPPAG